MIGLSKTTTPKSNTPTKTPKADTSKSAENSAPDPTTDFYQYLRSVLLPSFFFLPTLLAIISGLSTDLVQVSNSSEVSASYFDQPQSACCATNETIASWTFHTGNYTSAMGAGDAGISPTSTSSCASVSNMNRETGTNSTTLGHTGNAICIGAFGVNSTWVDDDPKAIEFTITFPSGKCGQLSGIDFYEQAPTTNWWIPENIWVCNNPPQLYGMRVLKDGVEVFKSIGNSTSASWTLKSFDFTSDPDFIFTDGAVFKFEFMAYLKNDLNCWNSIINREPVMWDLDDIEITGCCGSEICNNGMDDDLDGSTDCDDSDCTGTQGASAVYAQTGVGNSGNATGTADGNYAQVYDSSDEIVLDMGTEIQAGDSYTIVWRKKSTYTDSYVADMGVAESLNGSSFTTHPTSPSTTSKTTWVSTVMTANTTFRYLKMWEETASYDDFQLDAVTYNLSCNSSEVCNNDTDDDGDGLIDNFDPDCPCAGLSIPNLNFEKDDAGNALTLGTDVSEAWASYGIHITTNNAVSYPPIIFNSSSPTGGDYDLGTPNSSFGGPGSGGGGASGELGENNTAQGNLLVVSDGTGLGDNGNGGTLIFNFDSPLPVKSMEFIDVDYDEINNYIRLYNAANVLLKEQKLLAYGDNSYQKVALDQTGVSKVEVFFNGSGSVSALLFCDDDLPDATISGIVWEDTDGGQTQNGAEVGLQSIAVSLYDDSNNLLALKYTNSSGAYDFDNLIGGTYRVSIVAPFGYDATYDLNGSLDNDSGNFALANSQNKNNVNFGLRSQSAEKCSDNLDNDGDGVIDCYDPDCNGAIGYAAVVVAENGVINPAYTLGAIDGFYAQLHDVTDYIILDLGQTLSIGEDYALWWRRKSTYTDTDNADLKIEESLDNITYTTHPINPSTSSKTNFVIGRLSANIATRYIKISSLGGASDDFDLDAVLMAACDTREYCEDGIDNDNDGLIDCADPDCAGYSAILVNSFSGAKVHTYDLNAGTYVNDLIANNLSAPRDMVFGQDDMLYISDFSQNKVLRFNPYTGEHLGDFATSNLNQPTGLAFDDFGNLYVANYGNNNIIKFNGSTGAFLSIFASANGLNNPNVGMTFGSDGHLYVANNQGKVLKFNGSTGAFLGDFITITASHYIGDILFDTDGFFYLLNRTNSVVQKYTSAGVSLGDFTSGGSLTAGNGMNFGNDGHLYIADGTNNQIKRYNGWTGAFIDNFIGTGNGINEPYGVQFLSLPVTGLVVNSSGNGGDTNPGDGVCDDGNCECTLRAAIEEANALAGRDTIYFDLPISDVNYNDPDATPGTGDEYWVIPHLTSMEAVTEEVHIEGYSQVGARENTLAVPNTTNAALRIVLDGASMGGFVASNPNGHGLLINAGNCMIRGLVINRFTNTNAYGILVDNGNGSTIEGCYLGTDVSGNIAQANKNGLGISTNENTIGGSRTGMRNVLSGNIALGLSMDGNHNTIENNFIGLGANGLTDLGNGGVGLKMDNADYNTLKDNFIAGNTEEGIHMDNGCQGNTLHGNYIGTGMNGVSTVSNNGGIRIEDGLAPSNSNVIGGSGVGAGNLISGNTSHGINLRDSDSTIIQGNFIGVDELGNAMGNSGSGITMTGCSETVIGGTTTAERNIIAENGGGITMYEISTAQNNRILGTHLFNNGSIGIDLIPGGTSDGVTYNDVNDVDTGPNNLINFPEILTCNVIGGQLFYDFEIDLPMGDYRIEIFNNPNGGDPTGYGEGESYLGYMNITHPGTGTRNFSGTIAANPLPVVGDVISMTTTKCGDGTCTSFKETSEFSGIATVQSCDNVGSPGTVSGDESACAVLDPAEITETVAPSGGTGTLQYQWQANPNDAGWANISGATFISYDPTSISVTTKYRRGVRRNGCSEYIYSNEVTKTVSTCAENCGNGVDDDGDMLTDCVDPDCKPAAAYTKTDEACGVGGDGAIDLMVSGANLPFSYTWSDMPETARWTFEQNTNDISGNAHHQNGGVGTPAYSIQKIEGDRSLNLNGSTYIRLSVDGNFMETAFSKLVFAAWVKPSFLGGIQTIFDEGSGTNGISIRLNSNTLEAAVRNGSVQFNAGTHTFPNDGQWHHVAMVFDEGNLTLYLDGAAGTMTTASFSTVASHAGNGGIGYTDGGSGFGTSSGNYFTGLIDDVRYFYENTLNDAQIEDLARNDGDRTGLTTGTYEVIVANSKGCTTAQNIAINGGSNFTDGGSIAASEEGCGSFDPANIINITAPSGGSGGTIEYQWEQSLDKSNWSSILAATTDSYDPSTITKTTFYRRAARRAPCSNLVYSNVVVKTVVENVTNPGEISGDEENCGGFIPAKIASITIATGNGTIEYIWQDSTDGGVWTNIAGAVEVTYAPEAITETTFYRRGAKTKACTDYLFSNVVSKTVVTNVTDAGIITGNEEFCGSYDPDMISNVIYPSGGEGSTLQYQWQSFTVGSGEWTDINGATGESHDPSTIAMTTQFRRGARWSPCADWVYSNTIVKTVVTNYTDAGTISGNQSYCGSFDPSIITSIAAPSGGADGFQAYQWESNSSGTWIEISGATAETYDPPAITETTSYRRKARRVICTDWINSNEVTKTVSPIPTAEITMAPTGNLCEHTSYTFDAADAGEGALYYWIWGAYGEVYWVTGKGPHKVQFDVPDDAPTTTVPVYLYTYIGSCFTVETVNLVIHPELVITNVTPSNPMTCNGSDGSISITATYPVGADVEASIDGGDTWNPVNNLVFNNLSAGSYEIQIRYADGTCVVQYSGTILTDPTGPQATIVQTSDEVCSDLTTTFQANLISGSPTFSWDFGENASPSTGVGAGPHEVTYSAAGAKVVTLSLDDGGCNGSANAYLSVIDNFTDGGTIGSDEALCGTTDPSIMTSITQPSGGNDGNVEYQWQRSTNNGILWNDIYLATEESYDPSYVTVTMQYRRKARRWPCGTWIFSNVITKTPTSLPIANADNFAAACPGFVYVDNVANNDQNLSNPTYSIVTNPSNGVLDLDADGEFSYTPNSTFCGSDQFTYQVCNEAANCCATAVVTLDLADAIPPTLLNIPNDLTIHCDDQIPLPPLVNAVENCQSVSLDYDEISTRGDDSCSLHQYELIRTWTAIDYCGNNVSDEQTISIEDQTAPGIFRIYTLPNGKKMAAGVMDNVTHRWKSVGLPIQFSTAPVIFAQVISENDGATVNTRLQNVSTTQFQIRLQEEENADNQHLEEKVAWIAVEPGVENGSLPFEVGRIVASSAVSNLAFQQSYPSNPAFLATPQTYNETNPIGVRYNSLTTSSIDLFLEEETSFDPETTHGFETVGYFAASATTSLANQEGEVFGEVGTAMVSHAFQTIVLSKNYHNPVVVLGGISQVEPIPATIRVTNVSANSFAVKIEEWDYENGTHSPETISYLVVEGSIPLNQTASCSDIPDAPILNTDIVGLDNCDLNTTLVFTQVEPNFDCAVDSILTRTWYIEDDCGNSTQFSQNIILRDTTPPTFTAPSAVSLTCGTDLDNLFFTGDVTDEADNCAVGIEAVYTDNLSNLTGCGGYVLRVWTLSDFCGNSATDNQIIFITDPNDGDKDGLPEEIDLDDDNDGIPDVDETTADLDMDGIPNHKDLDSDNDGLPDIIEAGFKDINGDGMVDNFQKIGWDEDMDGLASGFDGNDLDSTLAASDIFEPTEFIRDRDQDGVPNYWDLDSDNDGLPDLIEAGGVDTDGNGIVDYPTPGDASSMVDGDGDGFVDTYDPDDDGLLVVEDALDPLVLFDGVSYRSGSPSVSPDFDSDNVPDFWDLDSDNDSTPDLIEASALDENGDGQLDIGEFVDANSNGFHDNFELFPIEYTDSDGFTLDGRPEDDGDPDSSPYNNCDPDNDGQMNMRDLDADGDGIDDIIEVGNGALDVDEDGDLDTLVDANNDGFDDAQSANPQVITNGEGSTDDGRPEDDGDADSTPFGSNAADGSFGEINGEPDIDDDGDGILNFLDLDSDDDFLLDKIENRDGDNTQDPGETDYLDRDSDDDLIIDGIEDANQDGTFTIDETNPLDPNTDKDHLDDGVEDANQNGFVNGLESDPRDPCDPVPNVNCLGVVLDLKTKLQGAMIDNGLGGLMRDDLRLQGLIPEEEPYSDLEFLHHVSGGGEVIPSAVLDIAGSDAVVDWILVELRSASRPDSLVATHTAILERDGDVSEPDGTPFITFPTLPSGDYYVALRHRNHLGIVTDTTHFLSPTPTEIDFTNTATGIYGDYPTADLSGERLMWGGDLNSDKKTIYQGPNTDIFYLFLNVLNNPLNVDLQENFISKGYLLEDLNLDGDVIYQGPDNDRYKMLFSIILNSPANTDTISNFIVTEELPENDNGTAGDPCLTGAIDPLCDFDGDGIENQSDPDDDNDGVNDQNDVDPFNKNSDSDGDGMTDDFETGSDGIYDIGVDTNPLAADTDGDLIPDNIEDSNQNATQDIGETSALISDTDGDGLEDGEEDANQNGVIDGGESDPLDLCSPNALDSECDFDNDGLQNKRDFDDDNDGVADADDIDPYNPNSDSDFDSYTDTFETNGDGIYHPLVDSDPLNPCDPNPNVGACFEIDADGDGYFPNYPLSHAQYDPNDENDCEPAATGVSCGCPDTNGNGWITICHNSQIFTGLKFTLFIPVWAWAGHEAHGDTCGPCNYGEPNDED